MRDDKKDREVGKQFMDIMQDYQECQTDNPNFEKRQALHDLYEDLVYIYDSVKNQS